MPPILELKGITKQFPGVLANDHINLTLEKGEILALLGENGAGKTTLMNILYGLYKPDEGEIFIDGEKIEISGPIDAIRAGIGMVHQHFMLIPVFTVTENVMLGEESVNFGGVLNPEDAAKKIKAIGELYGLKVDPNAKVGDLPVGVQQRVEIIKLLYRNARILIFDEPTAVLTPQEADELFEIMRSLTKQGKSIIFITHKLREVLEFSDRIMVIQRGKVVGETHPHEASQEKLAEMMVGRAVDLIPDKKKIQAGETVLKVDNLVVADGTRKITVHGVSFSVHAGEILGVAGVQGNGQTELEEALTGMREPVSGTIRILGKEVPKVKPREFVENKGAHIPEDRQRDGLILNFTVEDNLMLCTYYQPPFSQNHILNREAIRDHARKLITNFDIRPPEPLLPVASLSGGNQQKVIVARELSRDNKLIVASQPTRGLDVGSIEYIHDQLLKSREEGCGILLISSELDEIMELSDRIIVMYKGNITLMTETEKTTKSEVGLHMAGAGNSMSEKSENVAVQAGR
ncbi:MAG TPA: ABC transporter ATP-binding protein [Flexilinea sp.]|nr:ABC transporter ATP-binding protein [Flexilinea sp.]HOG21347.1 ABC transporter ATP-binding protein [Flexilinea sp.]HOP01135.1 ABC transporter ATP-binding protein [Flexilinea sp.]HOR55330.1 ABC transporter ATP-binding protein [Flexilinea sp.]HOU18704.1 ABC transporter ATP-binding protein [Flexilinea sp.]